MTITTANDGINFKSMNKLFSIFCYTFFLNDLRAYQLASKGKDDMTRAHARSKLTHANQHPSKKQRVNAMQIIFIFPPFILSYFALFRYINQFLAGKFRSLSVFIVVIIVFVC